jgi:ergothioneine biosynthesis protein EgtB
MALEALGFFTNSRGWTEKLGAPLFDEDFNLQATAETSPVKWHLAHTTWFFERFLLLPHAQGYKEFRPEFNYLFNSYYDSVGNRVDRDKRGLLSRPTLNEVKQYRAYVTEAVQRLFSGRVSDELISILVLGVHHEQQHQELILTDIKYNLFCNPTRPAYHDLKNVSSYGGTPKWLTFAEGVQEIGTDGTREFSFDNERPRHKVYLDEYQICSQQVSNHEFLDFIQDGGYQNPLLWLSDGWTHLNKHRWSAPLYWEKNNDGSFSQYNLNGLQKLNLNDSVNHISFYEADAFSRWKGARLPTEAEWENAAVKSAENFFTRHWDWTASAYLAYPGFKPLENAFGEYNAKFMSNQMVLRGGSHATPRSHIRPTYRNFFPPETRWQFTSLRLAQN